MTGRIWEHRLNTLRPEGVAAYLALWQERILPTYDEAGIRVYACWLPDDNAQHHLWFRVFEDESDRAARAALPRSRPDWPEIWAGIRANEQGVVIRDLQEIPATETGLDTPSPGAGGDYGVFQYRYVHLTPGSRDDFLEMFDRLFRPVQRDLGLALIGPWLPADDPDGFLSIWAFRDDADREATLDRIRSHPLLSTHIAPLQRLETGITSRILRSTPASPIGRYL